LSNLESQLASLQAAVAVGVYTQIVTGLKDKLADLSTATRYMASLVNARTSLGDATTAPNRTEAMAVAAQTLRDKRDSFIDWVESQQLKGLANRIGSQLQSTAGELSLPQAYFNVQTAGRAFYLPEDSAALQALYTTFETYQAAAAAVEVVYYSAKADAKGRDGDAPDQIEQVQSDLRADTEVQRSQLIAPLPEGVAAALPAAGVGNLLVASTVANSVPYDQVLPSLESFKSTTKTSNWTVATLAQLKSMTAARKNAGNAKENSMLAGSAWLWSSDSCTSVMGQGPFDPFTTRWDQAGSGWGNCKLVTPDGEVASTWHPYRNGQKSYANPWFVRPAADGERFLY
jgi:hypothetical protein